MKGVVRLLVVLVMATMVAGGGWAKSRTLQESHGTDITGEYALRWQIEVGNWDTTVPIRWGYPVMYHVGFCSVSEEDIREIKPILREVFAWITNTALIPYAGVDWSTPRVQPDPDWGDGLFHCSIFVSPKTSECGSMGVSLGYEIVDDLEQEDNAIGGFNWDGQAWIRVEKNFLSAKQSITASFAEVNDAVTARSRDEPFASKWVGGAGIGTDSSIFAFIFSYPPEPIDVQYVHWATVYTREAGHAPSNDDFYDRCTCVASKRNGYRYQCDDPNFHPEQDELCRSYFAQYWNDNTSWCPSYITALNNDGSFDFNTVVMLYNVNSDSLDIQYWKIGFHCSPDSLGRYTCSVKSAKPLSRAPYYQRCTASFVYLVMGEPTGNAHVNDKYRYFKDYSFLVTVPRLAVDPGLGWTDDLHGNTYVYLWLGWDKKLNTFVIDRWGVVYPMD